MGKFRIIIKHPFELLLIVVVTLSIFLPNLPLGSSDFMTDFMLLYALCIPILICQCIRKSSHIVLKWFALLTFFHLISTFLGYMRLGVSFHEGDFWAFVNEIKYLLIICIGSLCSFDVITRRLDRFIFIGSIAIIAISFLEFINPFGIASILGNYYSSDLHIQNMTVLSNRIVVTGSDPNIGACIIAFFLLYEFCSYLHKNKSLKYLTICILLLISLLMTSSRTVLAGTVASMMIFILRHKEIKKSSKIIIVIFFAATIVLLLPHFAYLTEGFSSFLSEEGNSSFNKRLLVWTYFFEMIKESPLLGWGVAESIIDGQPVDGEYILTLFRSGIIGLSLYLIINIKLIFFPKEKNLNGPLKFYKDYLTLLFITSLFVMFTNNFYSGKQLFQFYIAVLSVFYSGLYTLQHNPTYEKNNIPCPASIK